MSLIPRFTFKYVYEKSLRESNMSLQQSVGSRNGSCANELFVHEAKAEVHGLSHVHIFVITTSWQ